MNGNTLDALVEQWRLARDGGRALPAEELCRDRPDLLDALRARLSELTSAERTLSQGPAWDTSRELAEGPTRPVDGPSRLSPDLVALLEPPQLPDELGRLGGYRILRVLGIGGMGVVFEAEEVALGRKVALKLMKPDVAAKDDARQRFVREARATAAIAHDNIVPIHAVGDVAGVPFIAMQLLAGETLADRLTRNGTLAPGELRLVGRDLANGLAVAHAVGLIHRDVKPANVWLEAQGPDAAVRRARLLDFGLARPQASEPLTNTGALLGTPAYMAPEQIDAKPLDGRCDLFALGVVMYRAATGRLPFAGETVTAVFNAIATHTPKPPRAERPDVPRDLSDLIVRLLAKTPDARPASADAVVAAIDGKPVGRRPGRWAAAAILGATAVAAGILAPWPRAADPTSKVPQALVAAPPAKDPNLDGLRAEVGNDARAIAQIARTLGYDAVAVSDFTGPPQADGDGGEVIELLFADELRAAGLVVKPDAALRLSGTYDVVPANVPGLWTTLIQGQLEDAAGQRYAVKRSVLGDRSLALRLSDLIDPEIKTSPAYTTLLVELAPVAGRLAEAVRGMRIEAIRVGDFRGPMAGQGGSKSLVAIVLAQLLEGHGIRVRGGAKIGIRGELHRPRAADGGSVTPLACSFIDRAGETISTLPPFEIFVRRAGAAADQAAGPGAALRVKMDEMAKEVVDILKSLPTPVEAIRMNDFTGPETDDAKTGPMIAVAFGDALSRHGLRLVRRHAPVGIKGEYREVADEHTGLTMTQITAKVVFGSEKQLFEWTCRVALNDPLAGVFDADAKLPPAEGQGVDPRLTRVRAGSVHVKGSTIAPRESSPFAVELLVAEPGTTGVWKLRPALLYDGQPYVPTLRRESLQVRLHNRADFDAAVNLFIDGLSAFHFADTRQTHVVVKKGQSVTVGGWYRPKGGFDAFVVADLSESASFFIRSGARTGVITAAFAATWPKAGRPPADEPDQVSALAEGDVRIGTVRDTLSVGYARNAADDLTGRSIPFQSGDRDEAIARGPRVTSPP